MFRDYNDAPMEWRQIRSAFIRLRGRRPQHAVGKGGGLRQNAISKIEANDNFGPSVGVFVKAIQGLGLKPSEFFREVEQSLNQDLKTDTVEAHNPPVSAASEADDARDPILSHDKTQTSAIERFTREIERLGDRLERLTKTGRKKPKSRTHRRPRHRKVG